MAYVYCNNTLLNTEFMIQVTVVYTPLVVILCDNCISNIHQFHFTDNLIVNK